MTTCTIVLSQELVENWLLLARDVPHSHISEIERELNLLGLSAKFYTDTLSTSSEERHAVYVSPCTDMDRLRAHPYIAEVLSYARAGTFPCATPNCANVMPEAGDLCPPCKAWLDACERLTREDYNLPPIDAPEWPAAYEPLTRRDARLFHEGY